METMSKYFSKEDLERRKKSEEWVKQKTGEFCKSNTLLTFAEWCYKQGKAEARVEAIDELMNEVAQIKEISDEDWELLERKSEQLKEQI